MLNHSTHYACSVNYQSTNVLKLGTKYLVDLNLKAEMDRNILKTVRANLSRVRQNEPRLLQLKHLKHNDKMSTYNDF